MPNPVTLLGGDLNPPCKCSSRNNYTQRGPGHGPNNIPSPIISPNGMICPIIMTESDHNGPPTNTLELDALTEIRNFLWKYIS